MHESLHVPAPGLPARSPSFLIATLLAIAAASAPAQVWIAPGLGLGETIANEPSGAGIAVGDIDRDGHPDVVLAAHDARPGADYLGYRVGLRLRTDNGYPSVRLPSWDGAPIWAPNSLCDQASGAGVALVDVNGNGRLDIVLAVFARTSFTDEFRWLLGLDLDAQGNATHWQVGTPVPGLTLDGDGAGVTAGDVDGDGRPDLVFHAYEHVRTGTIHRYCVGYAVTAAGTFASVGKFHSVLGAGRGEGADACLAHMDADPRPELVLGTYDHDFHVWVGWNLAADGTAAAWTRGPSVGELGATSEGMGVAVLALDGDPRPDLIFLTYDVGAGSNAPNEFRARLVRNAIGVVERVGSAPGCTGPLGVPGLGQAMGSPPSEGQALAIPVDRVPAGSFGAAVVGQDVVQPGVNLGFVGFPACTVYTALPPLLIPASDRFVPLPPIAGVDTLVLQGLFVHGLSLSLSDPVRVRYGALAIVPAPQSRDLYLVDFGPPHQVGSQPVTGAGPFPRNTVSSVTFGNPLVVATLGPLVDRPCRLRSGDLIRFEPELGHRRYSLSCKLAVSLQGADELRVYTDAPSIRVVRFLSGGGVYAFTGGTDQWIGAYTPGSALRLRIDVDLLTNRWQIHLDDVLLHDGDFRGLFEDPWTVSSFRFALFGTTGSGSQVGLDDIAIRAGG